MAAAAQTFISRQAADTASASAAGDIHWHRGRVTPERRRELLGAAGMVLWLTGLSGSGKSTVAYALEERLLLEGRHAFVLDGDNLRHGLNAGLSFSKEDRSENIRRAAHVAALMADACVLAIVSFISPYRADRAMAREIVGAGRFREIYFCAPIEVCEARDPKGLYRKARSGGIVGFTGVDDPYEPPEAPDLAVDTAKLDIPAAVELLAAMVAAKPVTKP